LQYGFIQYLARDPSNIVVGLARNKAATDQKIAQGGVNKVTIIQADIVDGDSLHAAKAEVEKLTGGSLDYLINNAAFVSGLTAAKFLDEFEKNHKRWRMICGQLSRQTSSASSTPSTSSCH